MSEPLIRRILPEDWLLLKQVRLEALADSPDAFSTTLEQADTFDDQVWKARAETGSSGDQKATFLITDHDQGLGMITGLPPTGRPQTCQLISTWIAPTIRRRGYGTELTKTLIDWATNAGFKQMQLWVTTTNQGAVRLYTSTGFTPTGETKPLPSNPLLAEALYLQQLAKAPKPA